MERRHVRRLHAQERGRIRAGVARVLERRGLRAEAAESEDHADEARPAGVHGGGAGAGQGGAGGHSLQSPALTFTLGAMQGGHFSLGGNVFFVEFENS